MELVWTPRASNAREAAIDYIAEDNPTAALNQLDEIEKQTDQLLDNPERGRPGRISDTRELVILNTPFIVVYRVRPRAMRIEILRFLHGSQNFP